MADRLARGLARFSDSGRKRAWSSPDDRIQRQHGDEHAARALGTTRINERLDSYGLRQTRLFRPTFRDGKPDVLPDLEREFGLGMTTPSEMARLMAIIAQGKALNRQASDAMLATLRRQQDRAMVPRLLPSMRGLTVGNKTGTDEEKHAAADGVRRHVRADAAIVTGPEFTYTIAILAREVEDRRWSVDNKALKTGATHLTARVRLLLPLTRESLFTFRLRANSVVLPCLATYRKARFGLSQPEA